VALTNRQQRTRPATPGQKSKDKTDGRPERQLADRADFVAGSIFLFENRDPDGAQLDVASDQVSPIEEWPQFKARFGPRLRGLFHDLKGERLVAEEDLPLFYWPQTVDARIRLARRLREVARSARSAS
jgi:hypothetical protein